LGATAVVGINGMFRISRIMPPATRTMVLNIGGILGSGVFVFGNSLNSIVQNKVNNNNNNFYNNSKNNDGSFPAKSIIEENNNVNTEINFLYFNLFISICISLLIVLLIYLYRNKK
jgi:hypothetical protein